MTRSFDPVAARDTPPVASRPDRACAGADPAVFFPDHPSRYGPALAICEPCPCRTECLQWALDTSQNFGVWGGTTPEERWHMTRRTA